MNTIFAPTENRRWMLVDDNEDVLLMLSAVIQNLTPKEVECFNSPQSALAAFMSAPEKFELVITDFDMPGMNGAELCRHLHETSPALKVLLVTGSGIFSDETVAGLGFCGLLRKPFLVEGLKNALVRDSFMENPVAGGFSEKARQLNAGLRRDGLNCV